MIINKDDYNIILPFAPLIYESKLTDEQLKWVQDYAVRSANEKTIEIDGLAGNIEKQIEIPYEENDSEYFIELIWPHVKSYMKADHERNYELTKNTWLNDIPDEPDWNSLQFNVGRGPWFNYMKANEFNPVHQHTGKISGIIMVSVPEEIAKEPETYPINSNLRCPGQLEWLHGDYGSGSFKVIPQTGKFYLFPNDLRHQVYPFKSDVERITMSWNVFDPTFKKPIEVEY